MLVDSSGKIGSVYYYMKELGGNADCYENENNEMYQSTWCVKAILLCKYSGKKRNSVEINNIYHVFVALYFPVALITFSVLF